MKQFLVHLNFLIGKKGGDQMRSFEVKKVCHGDVINNVKGEKNEKARDCFNDVIDFRGFSTGTDGQRYEG